LTAYRPAAAGVAPRFRAVSFGAVAARRLLIVMLVLLGISTLAAALVDTRPIGETGTSSTIASETDETTTQPTETDPGASSRGLLVRRKLTLEPNAKPQVVEIGVGDQLELSVVSREQGQLEIPSLGLLEPVAPGAPARFDILATEPASYGIRLVEEDRIVARIDVTKSKRESKQTSGV
jgi:hypothetical protein